MINKLITEINEALSHNLYFAALSLALTLPDICGKAEYPEKGSTSRYKLWYDEYIGKYEKGPSIDGVPDMPYLSGEIVYNFRSSLFHQGNPNLDNHEYNKRNKKDCPIEHFKIVVETEKPFKIYGGEAGSLTIDNDGIAHREYRVNVRRLCMILCLAAESYYKQNKDKFTFFNYSILDWDKYIDSLPKEDRDMMLEAALMDTQEIENNT